MNGGTARHTGWMRLHVELEGEPGERDLGSAGADLAAFMSFANLRGFGATHPLIALADHLAQDLHIALGPYTTFYGHDPEDAEDVEKLEYAWQDPALLHETLEHTLDALEHDPTSQTLLRRGGTSALTDELRALRGITNDAVHSGRRIRLSFSE